MVGFRQEGGIVGAGQVIGVIGSAGAGASALVAAMMEGRNRELESGAFVREQLTALGIPDVYASQITDGGNFVRGWGMRTTRDGRRLLHPGMDIGGAGTQGTIVRAARSGVVEHSGQKRGYGEAILLRHSDGSSTLYAHLNERGVQRGSVVQGGSPIGRMGRTSGLGRMPANPADRGGRRDPRCQHFASMGPHLHFSVHGTRARKLPASVRFTISTPREGTFGIDPVRWAGSHGVRLSATSRT
jgi:murein DD-endopeptidase MepM/ murein hydrolase activator NlpD